MQTLWTADVQNKSEEKEEFQQYLANNTRLLKRLEAILKDKLQALDTVEMSLSSYETEGWAHKQAHLNGKRAAYQEIIKLTQI